jgi:hypothetical protein
MRVMRIGSASLCAVLAFSPTIQAEEAPQETQEKTETEETLQEKVAKLEAHVAYLRERTNELESDVSCMRATGRYKTGYAGFGQAYAQGVDVGTKFKTSFQAGLGCDVRLTGEYIITVGGGAGVSFAVQAWNLTIIPIRLAPFFYHAGAIPLSVTYVDRSWDITFGASVEYRLYGSLVLGADLTWYAPEPTAVSRLAIRRMQENDPLAPVTDKPPYMITQGDLKQTAKNLKNNGLSALSTKDVYKQALAAPVIGVHLVFRW